MSSPNVIQTAIHGRKLGVSDAHNLVAGDIAITRPAVDAVITVGDEDTDVREISIQLRDAERVAIDHAEQVEIGVYADAGGLAFAETGGSTGIEIDDAGALLAIVDKLLFRAISDATGVITLTWTDDGDEEAYLGVRLPSGRVVMSSALTNETE